MAAFRRNLALAAALVVCGCPSSEPPRSSGGPPVETVPPAPAPVPGAFFVQRMRSDREGVRELDELSQALCDALEELARLVPASEATVARRAAAFLRADREAALDAAHIAAIDAPDAEGLSVAVERRSGAGASASCSALLTDRVVEGAVDGRIDELRLAAIVDDGPTLELVLRRWDRGMTMTAQLGSRPPVDAFHAAVGVTADRLAAALYAPHTGSGYRRLVAASGRTPAPRPRAPRGTSFPG